MAKKKGGLSGSVYIIEDELLLAHLARIKLNGHFNNIEIFSDGHTGFEAIKENPPDVVILDIILPGMQGFEILKKIKSSERLSSVKVVIVTVKHNKKDIKKAMNLGADAYLNKPFNFEELEQKIQELLTECRQ